MIKLNKQNEVENELVSMKMNSNSDWEDDIQILQKKLNKIKKLEEISYENNLKKTAMKIMNDNSGCDCNSCLVSNPFKMHTFSKDILNQIHNDINEFSAYKNELEQKYSSKKLKISN